MQLQAASCQVTGGWLQQTRMGWGLGELQIERDLVLGVFCSKLQGLFPPTAPQRFRLGREGGVVISLSSKDPQEGSCGSLCRGRGAPATSAKKKTELPRLHRCLSSRSLPQQESWDGVSTQEACNAGDLGSSPGLEKIPWRREWKPIPVFLPGEFHGLRSLVSYSLWGHKESDKTERLILSLSDALRREGCFIPHGLQG